MANRYSDLLTDPRAFFEHEADDPSALVPAFVVLVVGALSAVQFWITWQQISEMMSRAAESAGDGGAGMASIMAAVGGIAVVFVFFGAFVAWLYYAVFIFGVSALLDGEGEFKLTALFVAWGFLPKVFELLVKVPATWYLTQQVSMPDEMSESAMQAYQQQIATDPVNVLVTLVGILSLVWSAYIWYEAVQVSRRLDGREALVAVGIPAGLILLTRVWGLVNTVAMSLF